MTVERQLILRSKGHVRYLSVSRIRQVGLGSAALAFAVWVGYASTSYFQMKQKIDVNERLIAESERAYGDLVTDVEQSRDRFLEIAGLLENNHAHLVGVLRQNSALEGDLDAVRQKLNHAEADRRKEGKRREALNQQISKLESKVRDAENRSVALSDNLQTTEDRLAVALNETDEEERSGDVLRGRITHLQARLTDVHQSQERLVGRITRATVGDIQRLNRVVAQTGLNVGRLLAAVGVPKTSQGGPFIPHTKAGESLQLDDSLALLYRHIDRWDSRQKVVRRLPLGEPVGTITSPVVSASGATR